MANNLAHLDSAYHALADPTRRGMLARLGAGPASVKELAQPFRIGLPTFLKHLKVLEASGLVQTRKDGRVRTCALRPERLAEAEAWLAAQRNLWEARTDRLAALVEKA
ncbi:ArsR/SmtB family transcription factor [Sandaracinobacteroides hominis]|uniref:ArsR/SmtB family transcription factor n=1 Tax=Sandaracinobacteroides hominis TaxID=2780086 RepID=UPI0018F73672|nr:metalloregulator ArsR/SmtB family transcription factor [Sandaracinobacteroides hominis]